MMLSNEDIKRVINDGQLTFTPYSEKWIRSSGITMHLGPDLLRLTAGHPVDVKVKGSPPSEKISITEDSPYELKPGEFLLGATYQKVTVGASLGFMIEGRSTLARVGLTIVQTAMLVYPGHANRAVTLELANHGPNSILLYPRMKIARVVLFELRSPSTERYDDNGKYRDQGSVGAPIFADEFMDPEI